MKSKALLIIAFALFISCGEMEIEWVKKIDCAGTGDYTVAAIAHVDKMVFCAGTFFPDTARSCCYVACYDSAGVRIWWELYQDPDGQATEGCGLIVQRDEGRLFDDSYSVYVHARENTSDTTKRSVLLKYREGALVWRREIADWSGEAEQQSMLLSDYAGDLYMIVVEKTPVRGTAVFIIRYDPDGRPLHTVHEYIPNVDSIVASIARAGNIVICGVDGDHHEPFYARYQSGKQGLVPVHVPVSGETPFISDAWIATDGKVYILGAVRNGENGYDFLTSCFHENDSLGWIQIFNGSAGMDDLPVALTLDDSACVYVTGSSECENGRSGIVTVKYDANGKEVWTRRFVGKEGESLQPYFLLPPSLCNDGSFYLYGTAGSDVLLVKYNRSGFLRWFTRIPCGSSCCRPAAAAYEVAAIEAIAEGRRDAVFVKFRRAEQFGLNRWD